MLGPGLGRRHLQQSVEAGSDLDGVEVAREISHWVESARLGLGIDDGLLVLVSPARWTDSNHVPLRLIECRSGRITGTPDEVTAAISQYCRSRPYFHGLRLEADKQNGIVSN